MKLRDLFASKTAIAVLAAGMAYGGAASAAADPDAAPVIPDPVADTMTTAQQTAPAPSPDTSSGSSGQGDSARKFNVTLDNPHMPYAVIGGVGGLAVMLSLYGASRRMRGSWLRASSAVFLSAALANPQILVEDHESLPTEVAIVVDRSASQGLADRDVETERMKAEILRQLEDIQGVNVRIIETGGDGNSLDGPDGTHLFTSIAEGTANIPPSQLGGVIVLSDGRVHDSTRLPGGGAPLHALISGQEEECDRRIVLTNAPVFGVVDEDVTVKFRVIDNCSGEEEQSNLVSVAASVDGEDATARTVRTGEEVEMTFPIGHRGRNIIELQAEALEGEITTLNNTTAASVEGIQDNLRVLVMSGLPNAGERSLRNLLKSDPALDIVHFTILRHPNKQRQDDTPAKELSLIAIPTQEIFQERLEEFDLIILDRWYNQGVLPYEYYNAINDYVREGGSVLAISSPLDSTARGINATVLREIMPVTPTGEINPDFFRPGLTETGERHPVIRGLEGAMPSGEDSNWGPWQRLIDTETVFGDVIMQGEDESPLVVLGRKDEGRVAVILSDGSWLWARGFEGGGPQQEMMRRISHWLLQEPDLEEEALRMRVEEGRLTVERQTLGDETEPVTLHTPSGETQTLTLEEVEPGLWQATIDIEEVGLYRAEQGEKQTLASAGTANPKEFEDTRSTMELLRSPVTESGGRIMRMTDAADPSRINVPEIRLVEGDDAMAGEDWIGVRQSDASVLTGIQKYSLFSGLLGMGLLMGALSVMWGREGGFSFKGNGAGGAAGGRRRTRSRNSNSSHNGPGM